MTTIRNPKSPEQVLTDLANLKNSGTSWWQVIAALKDLISASGSTIEAITEAILSGNWKEAAQQYEGLVVTSAFEALKLIAENMGFNTIGMVTGTDDSFIVGFKGYLGVVSGTTDTTRSFSYKAVGISAGTQEGVTVTGGIYLSTEELSVSDSWNIEFFASFGGDFGVGVCVEVFTTLFSGSGAIIQITTGEEMEACVGTAFATTARIP